MLQTAAAEPKLTIIAHDHDTLEHILQFVAEQYGDNNANARPCTKHEIVKTREFSLLENMEPHIALKNPESQPARNSEMNSNV